MKTLMDKKAKGRWVRVVKTRSVGKSWAMCRQPMLSLDEEPVLHGSGGVKLRVGKAGEL